MLLSPQVGNSKHLDSAFCVCVCVCKYLSSSLVSCTGNEATVVVGSGAARTLLGHLLLSCSVMPHLSLSNEHHELKCTGLMSDCLLNQRNLENE